ncbi:MAG: hypothetical protein AAB488_00770 [Patescibacteria group bacterium]
MGDTYFITELNCVYCGKENDFDHDDDGFSFYPGIAYSSDFETTFICQFCKKKNKIKMEFRAVKTRKSSNKKSVKK